MTSTRRSLSGTTLLFALSILISTVEARATLELAPCPLPGFDVEGRCGHLTVPVDRSDSDSPPLALKVVELPAVSEPARPERIFYLVGGPGRAATEGVEFFSDSLMGVRAHHRIVLLDLRGTGTERPIDCGWSLSEKLDLLLAFEAPEQLADCRARAAIDPSHLTTRHAVLDLEQLRSGLGADRVHLLGLSYGTRVAQVYARLFPDHVATVTLRGATVLGDVALHRVVWGGERQLQRTLERCATDPTCADSFPESASRLVALGERLAARPLELATGSGETIDLAPRQLKGLLLQTVYSQRGAASVPWLIDRLQQGEPPSGLFRSTERQLSNLALEPMLSVFCAEDVPWVAADSDPDPIFARVQRDFEPICRQWNVDPDPEILAIEPIEAPTLVLSGAEDPATPADVSEDARHYLPHGRFVVTPGLGHFPTWTSCFAGLAATHIDSRGPDALDTECAGEDHSLPFLIESPGERLRKAGGAAATILAAVIGIVVYRRRRSRR